MRTLRHAAVGLLALWITTQASLAATTNLTLIRGRNQDISPGYTIGRTAIGDPGICDFIIPEGRNSVVLVPKSAGTTNLILYDTQGNRRDTYQITVVPDLNQLAGDLAQQLGDIAGLEIAIRNNRIVASGSIFSDKDYQRIQSAIANLGDVVIADIRLDPEALRVIADEIERAIGREEIDVRIVRDRILLEGFAYSESQRDRAEAIARSLASDRVVNVVELKEGRFFRSDRMVHFDIRFLEVGYQDSKNWGLDWGDAIRTTEEVEYTRATDEDGTYRLSAVVENFLPNLNILVSEGALRQLLNPRIICKNGETAREVVDGGEVPVIVVNDDNVSVTYKEFGIIVEVAPLVDAQNNVDVSMMVSAVFPAERIAVSGVIAPAFDKDEVRTNVVLRQGQSLILTGLLSNRLRRGFEGWPFFGKIPLIRHFFGTKQGEFSRSELVVVVTPTVLEPGQGSPDVDQRLQQKLQFDLSVEPRFSTDRVRTGGASSGE